MRQGTEVDLKMQRPLAARTGAERSRVRSALRCALVLGLTALVGCYFPVREKIDKDLCKIAEQPFEWPRPGMAPLTISIGIASTGEFGTDLDQLLAAADSALYEAKRAGRDQVCVAERVRLQTSA